MESTNNTLVLEFILRGFSGSSRLHILVFLVVMLLFVFILAGNAFIIIIIVTNFSLHLPMYFFLVILSLTEIITNILVVPKVLAIIVTGQTTISREACFTQSYFYFFFTGAIFLYLGVMSFDRYIAICYPLRYSTIMRKEFCIKLIAVCLLIMFFCLLYPTIKITNLAYCGQIMDHLFCDSAVLLSLACTDVILLKIHGIITSIFVLFGPLILTIVSYILIVSAVIRIKSDTGRRKTFSTCLAHLTMVAIVFGTAIFIEIRPPSYKSETANKVLSVGTTMLAPLINPFVYTLRNQNVKNAIRDAMKRKLIFC